MVRIKINIFKICNILEIFLGWGKTSSKEGKSYDKLLEVLVPVVTEETCKAAMAPWITEDMICAGGRLGEDACGVGRDQHFRFAKRQSYCRLSCYWWYGAFQGKEGERLDYI